ncbi:MAG: hypothetical protein L3J99_06280 [Thermoplasmata archaeon]|nr:hypothetical protein [Thermoplasmata archaeon]
MERVEVSPRRPRWALSKLGQVLLDGLLVREALSFWTGHPYDFEVWLRTGHAIALGANPYSVPWPSIPGVSIGYLGQSLPSAAYLPFWPLLVGGLYRVWEAVGFGNRFVLYLLVKQPGIWADLLTAYLIYRLVQRATGDATRALAAATFWSLFPYAIVITAVWGQFDSIVVALVLGAWFVRGPVERNLFWGVGVLTKWVTAIFLPLEIFRERGIRRFGFLLAVLTPIGATLLVFRLAGWSLTQITAGSISQTSGGGYGMNLALLFTEPPLSGVFTVVPALYYVAGWMYVPGVFLAGWVGARWLRSKSWDQELRAVMLVVAVFLLLRWGLYEQYLLYLFSLMALDVAIAHPQRRAFLNVLIGLVSIDLLVNNDLGLRFLSPLNPGIWDYVSSIDNSGAYGAARTLLLFALAIAVTMSLVQWIRAVARDESAPYPWVLAWVPFLRRHLRPPGPP